MRKATLEMMLSSSNEPTEKNSAYGQDTSLQADLEWIENPFRNLHAKIYYRQSKASSKMTKDKNKDVKMDLKSKPPSKNVKNDQHTKLPNSWRNDFSLIDEETTTRKYSQNAARKDHLKDEGSFNSNTYLNGQDKTTYLNQRKISVFKDSLSEKDKITFPLIVTPRSSSREFRQSLNTRFVPSRASQQEFLPRIRYASFHSLVYEDEKKKRRKWEKRVRDSHETRCENNVIPQQNHISASRSYRPILRSNPNTTKHDSKVDNEEVSPSKNVDYKSRDHVNSHKTLRECNYISKDANSNLMALKAKLHRSAFI